MEYLLFMGWAFLLCLALWMWLVGFDDRKMRRWATIISIVVALTAAFAVYSWNTKNCSDYLIDDYQHGDVPVSCVGTYNTVPDKDKY